MVGIECICKEIQAWFNAEPQIEMVENMMNDHRKPHTLVQVFYSRCGRPKISCDINQGLNLILVDFWRRGAD